MNGAEIVCTAAVLSAGCLLLCRAGVTGRRLALSAAVVTVSGALAGWMTRPEAAPLGREDHLPEQRLENGYVSSASCRSCHPGRHASWRHSFHRSMTQRASAGTVLAPFDDVRLQSRGRSYHLTREGGRFYAELVDPDWELQTSRRGINPMRVADPPRIKRAIVLTTGSHHYQAYWISGRDGNMLRQLPFVYLLKERRWIPREDAFLFPPEAGRQFAVWNSVCIQCHSVAGQPMHDRTSNALLSRVAEFGIACEACHGPGGDHVRRHRNPLERYQSHWGTGGDGTIVNPADLDHRRSSEVCGQCHAAFYPKDNDEWWDHGYSRVYRPGEPLEESRNLLHYGKEPGEGRLAKWLKGMPGGMEGKFWPDGTCRVGGREFLAMRMSPCYVRGEMSCLSCHAMHDYEDRDDQLKPGMRGNAACTQCHAEERFRSQLSTHTHHAAGSAGSLCYNCHMPHTSYALFKGIRSHRVESPRAASSPPDGRPNACNLCHLDRSQQWTSERLADWYGQQRQTLPPEERRVAAGALWTLKGNAAQRALAAWHFGWKPAQRASGTGWMPPFLAGLLDDPYSAVRLIAGRSLRTLPRHHSDRFDFLASKAERAKARARVVQRWNARRREAHGSQPASIRASMNELPLLPDDSLDDKLIRRLRAQRDNRPVYISE